MNHPIAARPGVSMHAHWSRLIAQCAKPPRRPSSKSRNGRSGHRCSRMRVGQQLPRLRQVALRPVEIGIEGNGSGEDTLGLAG
jgi:hypothetical protein